MQTKMTEEAEEDHRGSKKVELKKRSFSYVAGDAIVVKSSAIKLQQFHRSVHAKRLLAWETCRRRVRDSIKATLVTSASSRRGRAAGALGKGVRDPEGDLINYSPDLVNSRTALQPWQDCLQRGKACCEQVFGTVLFADLTGFVSMVEALSRAQKHSHEGDVSETVISVLNCYFSAIIEICEAYGGHVMKFAGDAVQIFFEESKSTTKNTPLLALACSFEAIQTIAHVKLPVHLIKKPKVKFALCYGSAQLVIVGGVWARYEYFLAGELVERVGKYAGFGNGNDVVIAQSLGAEFCPPNKEFSRVGLEFVKSSEGKKVVYAANELLLRMRIADSFFAKSSKSEGTMNLGREDEEDFEESSHLFTVESSEAQTRRDLRQKFFTGRTRAESPAESIHAFVPVCVLLEIQQRIDFEGIRRLSVLFMEVHELRDGSTDLDKMQSVVTEVQVAVYAANGAIRQVMIDDKGFVIIAFFGLTTAHSAESDAMKASIRLLQIFPEISVRVGMGLSSGDCFHGNVGAPQRHEFAIVGQVVNRSARLMSQASKIVRRFPVNTARKAGSEEQTKCALLCDEPSRQRAFRGPERVKFVGVSMRLKGISKPINVYQPIVKTTVADARQEISEAVECEVLQEGDRPTEPVGVGEAATEPEEVIPVTLLKIVAVMSCHASLLHAKILKEQVEEKSLRLALDVHLDILCEHNILRQIYVPEKVISMYNDEWFIYLGACYEVVDKSMLDKVYSRCLEAFKRKMHLQIARTYDTTLASVRCPIRSLPAAIDSNGYCNAHLLFKIIARNYLSSGNMSEASRNLLLAAEDLSRLDRHEDAHIAAQQALRLSKKDAMNRYKTYALAAAKCVGIMARGKAESKVDASDQYITTLILLRIPLIGLINYKEHSSNDGSFIVLTRVEDEQLVTEVIRIAARTVSFLQPATSMLMEAIPEDDHPGWLELHIPDELKVYRTNSEVIEQRYNCEDIGILKTLRGTDWPIVEIILMKPAISSTVMQCFQFLSEAGELQPRDFPSVEAQLLPKTLELAEEGKVECGLDIDAESETIDAENRCSVDCKKAERRRSGSITCVLS